MKNTCYLCSSEEFLIREGKVRDSETLQVLECIKCGLVFLSSFDHIQEEDYQDSAMLGSNQSFKEWLQESEKDDRRRQEYLEDLIIGKSILDFGSGAGGFLTKCLPLASDVSGIELDKQVKEHYRENKIDYYSNMNQIPNTKKFDVITAFHVIEHLKDPAYILSQLSKFLKDEKSVMIVEVPSSEDALLTLYENEGFQNFTYWSFHLFLFNQNTFPELARKANLKINFLKHIQRYPLSNHLYWLSKNKPGGHKVWNFLSQQSLDIEYENILASVGKTDTLLISLSLK
ncbi:MAG: class I SAM-dependent methyltransferase [Leptospiraceae bacterium]|nr:class I SAM-dependent methyltransferase [Leptospiraceae bacterium]